MRGNTPGFTLIEILVVIGIMGLLFSLVIVAIRQVQHDAFNTRIQNNVRQLRLLAESAYDSTSASYVNWSQSPAVAGQVATILEDTDAAHGNPAGAPYLTVIAESEAKEFCISAPLHLATGGYSCIDARGVFSTAADECPTTAPLLCP